MVDNDQFEHVDNRWRWHNDYHDHEGRDQTLMAGLLWTIIVILVIIWLIGFLLAHIASPLIHILIIVAVILLIINLLSGRGARV